MYFFSSESLLGRIRSEREIPLADRMAWTTCILLLSFAATLSLTQDDVSSLSAEARGSFSPDITDYEWIGYDGWYNNPAHPDWGGAGRFRRNVALMAF